MREISHWEGKMLRDLRFVVLLGMQLVVSFVPQPVKGQMVRCLQRELSATQFALDQVRSTTGVIPLDFMIAEQSVKLRNTFGMLPEVYYLMGPFTLNAYASPVKNTEFSTGSVYLGRDLLLNELAPTEQGYPAIAGILAHEFAHVLQMNRNGPISSSALVELHADFLAGYYLGRNGFVLPGEVDLFARSLFAFGDPPGYYGNPDHGNGNQRVSAMLAGYHHSALTLSEVYDLGAKRAQELLGQFQDFGTGMSEMADDLHDPSAAQALAREQKGPTFNLSLRNPHAAFRYTYRNTGDRTLIVKAVVESRVVPVVDGPESSDSPSEMLTHKAFQFRLAPGESRNVGGVIRLTGQSDVVRALVVPREVVASESTNEGVAPADHR